MDSIEVAPGTMYGSQWSLPSDWQMKTMPGKETEPNLREQSHHFHKHCTQQCSLCLSQLTTHMLVQDTSPKVLGPLGLTSAERPKYALCVTWPLVHIFFFKQLIFGVLLCVRFLNTDGWGCSFEENMEVLCFYGPRVLMCVDGTR